MELVAVNFYPGASNTPLPQLNKLADIASSDVSFVKARQRPEETTKFASATRKMVVKKTVRKEAGCFIVQRRGGVSSPSNDNRRYKNI